MADTTTGLSPSDIDSVARSLDTSATTSSFPYTTIPYLHLQRFRLVHDRNLGLIRRVAGVTGVRILYNLYFSSGRTNTREDLPA
jgi:hypothetical protein